MAGEATWYTPGAIARRRSASLDLGMIYTQFFLSKERGWRRVFDVARRREADADARAGGYAFLPEDVAQQLADFLPPAPCRSRAAAVCQRWARACAEPALCARVLPVERLSEQQDCARRQEIEWLSTHSGDLALNDRDDAERAKRHSDTAHEACAGLPRSQRGAPHFSLRAALRAALPGETHATAASHAYTWGVEARVEAG